MADNPKISNRPLATNPDYNVRADDIGGTTGIVQHVRLDVGTSTTESQVSDTNPMPIAANTAKDGSGTKTIPITDSDGHLQVDVLYSNP